MYVYARNNQSMDVRRTSQAHPSGKLRMLVLTCHATYTYITLYIYNFVIVIRYIAEVDRLKTKNVLMKKGCVCAILIV